MKKVKVILADDNDQTRSSIRQLMDLDNAIDVVAEVSSGREVLDQIPIMEPEVVVMDLCMPGMDGLETTRHISMNYPQVYVIIISVNDELQNFRKAMMAGAKEYLVKPLSAAELNQTIKQIADLNRQFYKKPAADKEEIKERKNTVNSKRIISIFGTKGGVGKSTICANLSMALAQQHKNQVGLVDLDIQFGDVSIIMNLSPRKTLSELVQETDALNQELLQDYLYERNGVNILAAPNKPELAELVTPAKIDKILRLSREMFEYTLVDTPSFMDENVLTALEMSDLILAVISLELPTIKNVKKGLEILRSLQLLPRTRLILNRSSGIAGIEPRDVEKLLNMKIQAHIPSDGKSVVSSLNQGIPFVKMYPKAPISKSIETIVQLLDE